MTVLKAESRELSGKGAARAVRREGKVPAVIYGGKDKTVSVTLNAHALTMAMKNKGFYTSVMDLDIEGKNVKVLPRDVQRHPLNEAPMHVDFLRFDPNREIHIEVSVRAIDEEDSPGIDKGGVLQYVRTEVEVVCRADHIPQEIVFSVAGKDIGDSVHMSEITLPEGVRPAIEDRDFTIASIISTQTAIMSEEAMEAPESAEVPATAQAAAEEGAEGDKDKK